MSPFRSFGCLGVLRTFWVSAWNQNYFHNDLNIIGHFHSCCFLWSHKGSGRESLKGSKAQLPFPPCHTPRDWQMSVQNILNETGRIDDSVSFSLWCLSSGHSVWCKGRYSAQWGPSSANCLSTVSKGRHSSDWGLREHAASNQPQPTEHLALAFFSLF